MRIVCENCSKKYVISDDKVRGKLFKIRCKKCSHVIVVHGTQDLAGNVDQVDTKVYNFDPDQPAPEQQTAAIEWFFVKDGEQAGPAGAHEIETYIATGQITDDTYLWREGMGDWLRYRDVPEFMRLRAAPSPMDSDAAGLPDEVDDTASGHGDGLDGVTFSSGDVPVAPVEPPAEELPMESSPAVMRGGGNGHGGALDAFASSAIDYSEDEATQVVAFDPATEDEPAALESPAMRYTADEATSPMVHAEPVAAPAVVAPPVEYGGFEEATTPRQYAAAEPAYSFEALAEAPTSSAGHSGEFGEAQSDLIGARSENSVLFSLDLLSDSGGNAEPQTTEGSGLIDIRALAASQGSSMADGTERESSGNSSAVLAPAVMPMGRRQSNTVLYIALSAAAVVILALVATIVVVLTRSGEEPADDTIAEIGTPTTDDGTNADGTEQTGPEGSVDEALIARYMADSATAGSSSGLAVASDARGAAGRIVNQQAVAVAEAPPANAREATDDRRRERETADEPEEEPPTVEEVAAAEARRAERRERRDREQREREENEQANEDDPVAAALSRIRPNENSSSNDESSSSRQNEETETEREEVADSTPPPASDLPEELSSSEVRRTVRRYNRRLSECRQLSDVPEGERLRIDVAMTVQGTGRVASARSDSSDDAARCVVSVVRDMRFSEFSGDPMSFTYPFNLR